MSETKNDALLATPRTDAMCEQEFDSAAGTVAAWTKLARELERELNARKGDPVTRLHNLCRGLEEHRAESPYNAEALDLADASYKALCAENADLKRAISECSSVKLWECPECCFRFDASHTNADGSYSCPVCSEGEDDALRDKMADILTRTAIALKGLQKPLQRHDWSDLPLLAGLAKSLAEEAMAKLTDGEPYAMACRQALERIATGHDCIGVLIARAALAKNPAPVDQPGSAESEIPRVAGPVGAGPHDERSCPRYGHVCLGTECAEGCVLKGDDLTRGEQK